MSGFSFDVRAAMPCACQSAPAANPPLDVGALVDVFDELGEHVALGELARRAGYPLGAELAAGAVELAERLEAVPETGYVGPMLGAAVRTGARLEGSAARTWAKLAAKPELLRTLGSIGLRAGVVVGGLTIADSWLNGADNAALEQNREWRDMLAEKLALLSPKEAATLLLQNPFVPAGSGGLSVWWLVALGGAGLLAWRWLR